MSSDIASSRRTERRAFLKGAGAATVTVTGTSFSVTIPIAKHVAAEPIVRQTRSTSSEPEKFDRAVECFGKLLKGGSAPEQALMKMFASEWTIKVLGWLGLEEGMAIEDKRFLPAEPVSLANPFRLRGDTVWLVAGSLLQRKSEQPFTGNQRPA